jgi:hypothetical protein
VSFRSIGLAPSPVEDSLSEKLLKMLIKTKMTNYKSGILVWLAAYAISTFPIQGEPIIINELMYHPSSENTKEEYVELLNASTNAVHLAGWRFTTGVRFVFPDVIIPPGGYLVVAADLATFTSKYPLVTNVIGGWDGILSNSGQLLELVDDQGQRVNSVRYADEGDWAPRVKDVVDNGHRGWTWTTEADGGGKSLELINPILPNKYGQNWAASVTTGGTPGKPNSVAQTDIAPLIVEALHFPLVPKSTNAVMVTARILDEQTNGISVMLHYRLDGAPGFTAIPMSDDGQQEDGVAGDGVYGAILPPQANHAIIEFYFEARDSTGHVRTWPAPAMVDGIPAQVVNLLYQVDDTVYTGNQPLYQLILTSAEQAELRQVNSNSPSPPYPASDQTFSHAQFNGTFISSDGTGPEVRYLVAIRNRGNGSRRTSPQSYRLNFRNDQPWKNVSALNLNTQKTDAQLAGSAVYRHAGLPTQESRAVQVRVNSTNYASNGSTSFGLYACNEVVDSNFAARHFPADSSGNLYRGIRVQAPGANLSYLTNSDPYRVNYFKQSNTSEDDWSDLVELTRVLDQTPDANYNYTQEIRRVIDVEEWMKYFALETLVDNRETDLGNGNNGDGEGDDYFLYIGVSDPRAQVVPYDLDTVMGYDGRIEDGLFRAAANSRINRFLKWPAFAPLYYAELIRLLDTTLSSEQLNVLLDQTLEGYVPNTSIEAFKTFMVQRTAFVRSQIPLNLTVTTTLPVVNGYPHATNSSVRLNGLANVIHTRSISVNGTPTAWSAWEGKWTNNNVSLKPGINRVLVQALDADGKEIDRTTFDVWFDKGAVTTIASGTLTGSNFWSAASSPYKVTASLTVASGGTLAIEPGTTVYFDSGVNLTVANGGRLLAEGTEFAPIRFTRAPGGTATWGGITVNGGAGSPETRLAYVHLEFNGSTAIHSAGGTVFLDHLTFGTTDKQYLSLDDSSFVVSECVFPTPTAAVEPAHGTGGIKSGGRGIFLRNFFGVPNGYNDVIDFTGGKRPGPIVQFIDNVFIGASDDILDLDGTDAWVEGNIFLHAHKNDSPDSSSAVSGGGDGGRTSEVTIIGNLFYDCDQAATVKEGNFFTLINNTIVHQTRQGGTDTEGGVINLAEEGTTEGAGMYLEDNIIYDAEALVRNLGTARVTFTNNILSLPWNGPGGGNEIADPQLRYIPKLSETAFTNWAQAQVMRDWFSLRPGSPARGAGSNGRDQGGVIPLGISVSGEPSGTNYPANVTLTVGGARTGSGIPVAGWPYGSGYTHYRWRLDGGAWSVETPVAIPISVSGLSDGAHYVELSGKRDSGWYQDDAVFAVDAGVTRSRSWVFDTNYIPPVSQPSVRINEILARNVSAVNVNESFPDLVELYNTGGQPVDLADMRLATQAIGGASFVFPAGTILAPAQYLVVSANNDQIAPGLHLGFKLSQAGESLFLFDKPANGGALLDSVTFGLQVADFSIGRLADGQWALTRPSLGAENIAALTGDPLKLRINEWLADGQTVFAGDFIELYNPNPLPVSLDGLFLVPLASTLAGFEAIAPLSYIAGKGYAVFTADGQPGLGASHLDFKLPPEQGMIALFTRDQTPIDVVLYGPQSTDVSQGRSPNGADTWALFPDPTPGSGNPGTVANTNVITQIFELVTLTNVWKFDQTTDPGADWMSTNFAGDSAWPSGAALLYVESNFLPAPKNTPLTLGRDAYYFRTHFTVQTNLAGAELNLYTIIDDGAVFYINGHEVYRIHMPLGSVSYTTHASDHEAAFEGPFPIPLEYLQSGDNLMAVEVHQASSGSSDIVFGMSLEASITITNAVTNQTQFSVVLNEILANCVNFTNQDGVASDWIELYNPGAQGANLAGLSLSDDATAPTKWVFPTNAVIPAGGYLVILCEGNVAHSASNTGFGLKAGGGSVYLFDSWERGGALLDSVTYGIQAADWSIGRTGTNDPWILNYPTPASPNLPATLGEPRTLKINEWMADPTSGDDWFELYNPDPMPVELSGLFLTDDLNQRTQYPIPDRSFVGTGQMAYQKFIADNSPAKAANHTNFKLSAGGESIGLFTREGLLIDAVTFGPQLTGISQGRLPDGATEIVPFPTFPTPGESNYLPLTNVVINEVLAHAALPLDEAIEFYNPTGESVNVGGWYLSNSADNFKKFRLPEGTLVPAGGYHVLYGYQFNPASGTLPGFTLNRASGSAVYLSRADAAGALTGNRTGVTFGATEPGVSVGRFLTRVGVDFVAMSRTTFGVDDPSSPAEFRAGTGLPNAYPKVGPVVINEIMYHPSSGAYPNQTENPDEEYIELHNLTTNRVALFDSAYPSNGWRIANTVDYVFPPYTTLPPQGHILVVGFDPATNATVLAAFRTRYGVSSDVPVFGPYQGRLDNAGESVELWKPGMPPVAAQPEVSLASNILVDRVQYSNQAPWPMEADGLGLSLQRLQAADYGNDPANWIAGLPTAGRANLATEVLKVEAGPWNGEGFVLRFVAQAGIAYTIQYRDSITDGGWQKLSDVEVQATARLVEISDPTSLGQGQRFYRIIAP